jgi:hypothetical protein
MWKGFGILLTRDPGWQKFGSEFRDKHPGSATLVNIQLFMSAKSEQSGSAWICIGLAPWIRIEVTAGSGSALKPVRIRSTGFL